MSKKIVIKIQGMECPNCAMILELIENKLGGILSAEASYHKEQLVVIYDEAQVNEERIYSEIRRMGYEVAL